MPFLIIFILIPIAEVYAFISVGEEIGVLRTLLLCVLTAAIGGFLVRHQGIETLMKARQNMSQGTLPMAEIFDGICLVISGALLLTPGFVTDVIGFSLLVPYLRKGLRHLLTKYGKFKEMSAPQRPTQASQEGVIEGEFEEITPEQERLDKKNE